MQNSITSNRPYFLFIDNCSDEYFDKDNLEIFEQKFHKFNYQAGVSNNDIDDIFDVKEEILSGIDCFILMIQSRGVDCSDGDDVPYLLCYDRNGNQFNMDHFIYHEALRNVPKIFIINTNLIKQNTDSSGFSENEDLTTNKLVAEFYSTCESEQNRFLDIFSAQLSTQTGPLDLLEILQNARQILNGENEPQRNYKIRIHRDITVRIQPDLPVLLDENFN